MPLFSQPYRNFINLTSYPWFHKFRIMWFFFFFNYFLIIMDIVVLEFAKMCSFIPSLKGKLYLDKILPCFIMNMDDFFHSFILNIPTLYDYFEFSITICKIIISRDGLLEFRKIRCQSNFCFLLIRNTTLSLTIKQMFPTFQLFNPSNTEQNRKLEKEK